uniref:peptidyl-tRNA hydrolase n=1 Tax=Aplanochytrium stocchinoi TaxID=215587 RepID=A0A7S3LQK8_9STRA
MTVKVEKFGFREHNHQLWIKEDSPVKRWKSLYDQLDKEKFDKTVEDLDLLGHRPFQIRNVLKGTYGVDVRVQDIINTIHSLRSKSSCPSVIGNPGSLKLALCVRCDLNMGPGKIAKLCSLASLLCDRNARLNAGENHRKWISTEETIGCVQVETLEHIKSLKQTADKNGIFTASISEEGDKDNIAVLGLGPASFADLNKLLGKAFPILL